ncbi:nuclear speckle splicing regulatory protein 1-like isoform X2 [Coregonus clupeaformis]|uniref:nuclear speckle splicing regulatory protein 1-like isoform X2 n=1 Tax=Coregonus clupeaformis TaxID=59861 RepID=UPI001E1C49DB|nr:nuclear speckle splicing regulatory protein 1-like isoform X2 [Coregonus clupeaformis]
MDPERHSRQRQYEEPERYSRRREYGEPSSGQWDDDLEKRGNGQGMAREPYSEYSSMRRTREGWEEYGASSAMNYSMDPSSRDWSKGSLRGSGAPFSPDTDDGDPVEPSVEDMELARKKKELEVIQEKIARKKAVLAMQKVKQGAKDNNVADKSSHLPLKRRVLDIVSKLRRTPDTPAKPKKRAPEMMISAPLENEEAHPLRLRVRALTNQRRYPNNEEVDPNDKQHNPTIKRPVHSLRTQEQDIAATGFQRFLNVLNEGVDINKLSKIVNNVNELPVVGEELPQVWPTLLEGNVDSSSRSKSSPVEEKKVVGLEDEQRYERMQTLLEIVGLDLGVEELGRLTDRTNDRLYGKMGDLKRKENGEEREPSFKHLSTSSLPSDSTSPSPLLNQHSNMTVEYSSSSNRVWDIERHRDRSERDWHRHSSTRDRDEDIVRERDKSERDGERDGHRHSSTRERDKDLPVVRERNRSERNGEKDCDRSERDRDRYRSEQHRDPEKDRDGGREKDRDRSERDRDPEKDRDGEREKDRDRSERDRDRYRSERDRDREPGKGRDGGREKDWDRVRDGDKSERDRNRYRSERDRNREIDKDIDRWLQRTRDGDKPSRTRNWNSESDWDSYSSTRDWDIERSERNRYGDESRESSIELNSYSMNPIYPVSHPPHASMMATCSTTQYSQYMAYQSSPYTIAFPPGWGYPPGTMPPCTMLPGIMPPGTMLPGIIPTGAMLPGIMPPGIMPAGAMLPGKKPLLPNAPGDLPYTNFPPYYSNGTTALNQTYAYTQPASNLQLSITPAGNRKERRRKKAEALAKLSCQMATKKSPPKLQVFRQAWKDSTMQYRKALTAARSTYLINLTENKKNPKCISDAVEKLTKKQHSPAPKMEGEGGTTEGEELLADTIEKLLPQVATNDSGLLSEPGPKKEPEREEET